jgi:hypothetical protein
MEKSSPEQALADDERRLAQFNLEWAIKSRFFRVFNITFAANQG